MTRSGALLVISGTGGAGKGSVVDRLRQLHPELWWSVSWATRPPRPDERDGEHYWFRTRDEFEALRADGGFLEWADVYGVLKGTPKAPLLEALAAGHDALLEMDVQGAHSVSAVYPDAHVVFIVAPSRAVQEQRLEGRGTDGRADIAARLDAAAAEEAAARAAGFTVIVNDDLDHVVGEVAAILDNLRSGAPPSP